MRKSKKGVCNLRHDRNGDLFNGVIKMLVKRQRPCFGKETDSCNLEALHVCIVC